MCVYVCTCVCVHVGQPPSLPLSLSEIHMCGRIWNSARFLVVDTRMQKNRCVCMCVCVRGGGGKVTKCQIVEVFVFVCVYFLCTYLCVCVCVCVCVNVYT